MRILFLAHFYPPEMGGAGARLHGLARMLVKAGHEVTVITGFPNYPKGRFYEGYRGKRFDQEVLDGVHVVRTWVYTSPKKGGIRRLANYFSFVASSVAAGLRLSSKAPKDNLSSRMFDAVFASSPPLFIGLSGLLLAKRFRCPFVFDIRDIWPELAVEAGEFLPEARIVRLGEKLESFLYRYADHIVVVTERKRKKLFDKGVRSDKISVVANGVDLDRLGESDFDWRNHLGLQGKFVALYAGLIGIFQGVEIIAQAAKELQNHKNIHFVIVGDGVKRGEIEAYIKEHQLDNITMVPSQPREQIPAMLRSFDLALVPLVNENLVDAVPSKLLEAMGCRRPVMLIAGGESRRLLQESQAGVIVPPASPSKLAQAIISFQALPVDEKCTFAQNGYDFILKYHDREQLAQQLAEVFEGL